jgi:cytochrome c oxidase subunit 2
MSREIAHVTIRLNEVAEPVQVLRDAPYRFQLDPRGLPEGSNRLLVEIVYADGGSERKEIPFTVARASGIQVEGLDPGNTIRNRLDVTVRPARPRPPAPRLGAGIGVAATVAVLGAIWALFATAAPSHRPEKAPTSTASAAGAAGAAAPGPAAAAPGTIQVSPAVLEAGQEVYTKRCASCHQPKGTGIPATFPPLAGNPHLSDAELIVHNVHSGHTGKITVEGKPFDQTMPPIGAAFTATQIAEVATYVRNSWGNAFGPVTTKQVKKFLASDSTAASEAAESQPVDAALLKEGAAVYKKFCVSCHQPKGTGIPATFPPLAGNPHLSDAELIVHNVHSGHTGKIKVEGKPFDQTMPPIGAGLSPRQIAAVATYVRNTWGNHFGGVSAKEAERILGTKGSKP